MTSTVTFGVIVDVNDKEVTLSASDLTDIKKNGITYNYDPDTPTQLGSLQDLVNWMNTRFSNAINLDDLESIPVVGDAIKTALALEVSVSKMDVHFPGSQSTGAAANTTFLLNIAATLDNAKTLIPNVLDFKGFTLGVDYTSASS